MLPYIAWVAVFSKHSQTTSISQKPRGHTILRDFERKSPWSHLKRRNATHLAIRALVTQPANSSGIWCHPHCELYLPAAWRSPYTWSQTDSMYKGCSASLWRNKGSKTAARDRRQTLSDWVKEKQRLISQHRITEWMRQCLPSDSHLIFVYTAQISLNQFNTAL